MSEQQAQGSDPFGQWMQFWQASAEKWQEAVQSAVKSPAGGSAPWLDPMDNWRQWTDQWMKVASSIPGAEGFAAAAQGVGPATLGRFGQGSELYLSLGQMWLRALLQTAGKGPDAWKGALNAEALQEMQSVWKAQLGKLAESMAMMPLGPAATSWMGGFQNLGALGQTVAGQLSAPWGEAARDLGAAWQQSLRGDPEAMRRFARTWKETYDKTHGRLLQSPMLGYSREPTERWMRSLDALVDYLSAVHEFTMALERVGRTAGQRWMNSVSELTTDGTIPTHRTIYRQYLQTFEESYAEVFKSPEYSRLQSQMVDAGLRFRRRLDQALEDVLQVLPVPTNSEMKELYQAFHDLRSTVKQQQRRIAQLEAQLGVKSSKGK